MWAKAQLFLSLQKNTNQKIDHKLLKAVEKGFIQSRELLKASPPNFQVCASVQSSVPRLDTKLGADSPNCR